MPRSLDTVDLRLVTLVTRQAALLEICFVGLWDSEYTEPQWVWFPGFGAIPHTHSRGGVHRGHEVECTHGMR